MKKIYTLFAALTIGSAAFAQCTISPLLFGAPGNTNYSIIPDTITNLPLTYVSTAYTTDLQFHIQPDTTVTQPISGTYNITQVHIDSVIGLLAGFSYLPNPSNGIFFTTTASPPGTGYGCVAVTGLATPGQELGGPNSDGIYPIIVYYTATVDFFSVPTPIGTQKSGYRIQIMPANGINTYETSSFSVNLNVPNPADVKTEFRYNTISSGNVQFTMYNVLGSVVKQESITASKGMNHFTLETANLTSGVYMCSFRMGDTVVTRRITVSH